MFYTTEITDKTAIFSPEESTHIVKALRKKRGSKICFTDGAGFLYEGEIITANVRLVEIRIINIKSPDAAGLPPIHIIVAPTKNIDRIEWFVEKATEVGVAEISFIVTENSERRILKTDRLKKIAVSAMKQSNQLWLPKINELTTLQTILNKAQSFSGGRFFGYCNDESLRKIKKPIPYNEAISKNIPATILIGPEGDFTENEARKCIEAGFSPVVLTKTRLRTETAALFACWNYAIRHNTDS
ncbi:MAG: 16S rRNA (uracil(1498)-N(3))-methyltransferase [Bacteroidales bacterium]|jgi:16S rRNA (uracil1498-N3)-methyltransferase|nr:16S rRNA (uracil(1498)-N(3))-methyltransferase [Bacteroidales bacterium]